MPGKLRYTLAFLFFATSATALLAQTKTNDIVLKRMSGEMQIKRLNEYGRALQLAKEKGWFVRKNTLRGGVVALVGVDELGNPKYVGTFDNIVAAATTRANQLWPGGSSGLSLSGSSASVKGKMGIWDGGHALTTHVELTGRILVKDNSGLSDHATHTSGTLIATGINPIAKGMAFQAQQLISYDFDNDLTTMAAEASSLVISNHSYGFLAGSGWSYDGTNWDWYGDTTISKTQGYAFGYYDQNSQIYDSIAYNAPFYLISVAAGNPRAYNGPPVDSPYLYNGNKSLKRSPTLGNNPTYTSVCNTSDAKNIIAVGAVNGIPAGYSSSSDVVMSDFSAWGPTSDGRIKPDIVADGVNVTSTWSTSNTAYSTQSGTSMATPNVTGSLYLLQEYYNRLHPSSFMRSATLKGLAIHTADEAGTSEGPDYEFGWGLLNVLKGANVITSSFNHQSDTIIESVLNSATNTYTFTAVASGKGPIVATLSWTDPAATPVPVIQAFHNTTSMLVNDLDMRITAGTQTYKPWILDPANPANPATTGDNFRDNVEKINIDSVTPGQTYTITITHKGTLARGQQAFSLLISGIGGQAYCVSAPTSSAGTRIDSVNLSDLHNANPVGCTTYTNYTNLTAQIQPNKKLPISIKLSSCDASTASKVVKVYIDYNNNGVFDANELASQSTVLSGNVTYNDTIITPANLTTGNYTTMRIVAEETTDPTTVLPCGTYGKGETQDYRILIARSSLDVALTQIISPASGDCGDPEKIITVGIRNTGTDTVTNVPISVVISNGSSSVSSIGETYPGKIPPGFLVTYTFQQTFNAAQGSTYNVNAYVRLPNDQNSSNDTLNSVVTIAAEPGTPAATATVTGDTVTLKVTNPDPALTYFWYASDTSENPLFASTDTSITLTGVPAGNALYVGTGINTEIGVKSKNVYPNGGGYQAGGGNWLSYTSQIPLTLNSARLYTGNPGKVTIMVVDTIAVNGQIEYFVPPLSSTTIDVYSTSQTPQEGSRNNDPNDNGAVFYINLPLPAGKHVIMDTTVDASVDKTAIDDATIFRNNNVTGNPYPFKIGNVFSITGNSATSTTNSNQFQNYYYYLYNMKLETNDCLSSRTKVPVSVPSNIAFNVWPNPTHGSFTILMSTASAGSVEVELFDLLGRRCFAQNYSANGIFSTQISTGTLITGMYILSVKDGSKTYIRKVLVLK